MGCLCTKKLKTEEEAEFEQNKEEIGINITSNYDDIENKYKTNKTNENLKTPAIAKKSKTFVSSIIKNEEIDINNSSDLEKECLKNNNPYSNNGINANQISQEELDDLFLKYKPFNDSVIVEIRPSTFCENQTIYYGEWDKANNFRHGRGIQLWPDGSKYSGQWKNNNASGKGKLLHSNGDIYEGEWDNNKPNGFGEYIREDGNRYIGEWKNDKQDGKGEETWIDGSKYEGEFKEGKKNGFGKFTWIDGNIYEGNFKDNLMDGKGKFIFNDKRVYEGDLVKNRIEGKGVLIFPDGRKYEGEFKNDKKDGYGIFTSNDGKIYKGGWKNGKQNGEGELYLPKKNIWKKGIWENGKRIKWLN